MNEYLIQVNGKYMLQSDYFYYSDKYEELYEYESSAYDENYEYNKFVVIKDVSKFRSLKRINVVFRKNLFEGSITFYFLN